MTMARAHPRLEDYDPFVDSVGPVHLSEGFFVERLHVGASPEATFRKSLRAGASDGLKSALRRELRLAYLNWCIPGRVSPPPEHVVLYSSVTITPRFDSPHAIVETEDAGPSLDLWRGYALRPLQATAAVATGLLTPRHLVELMRTVLLALRDELHSLSLLHCDIYERNICIPFERHPTQAGALRPRIDRLRLIDLGTAVQPHTDGSFSDKLILNPDASSGISYRYSPALRQALRDDAACPYATHVHRLDCRVDLYALGHMALDLYGSIPGSDWDAEPAAQRNGWSQALRQVCVDLHRLDSDGQAPPPGLHDGFIQRLAELGEALGPGAPGWWVPQRLPPSNTAALRLGGVPAAATPLAVGLAAAHLAVSPVRAGSPVTAAPTPVILPPSAAATPVIVPSVAAATPVIDPWATALNVSLLATRPGDASAESPPPPPPPIALPSDRSSRQTMRWVVALSLAAVAAGAVGLWARQIARSPMPVADVAANQPSGAAVARLPASASASAPKEPATSAAKRQPQPNAVVAAAPSPSAAPSPDSQRQPSAQPTPNAPPPIRTAAPASPTPALPTPALPAPPVAINPGQALDALLIQAKTGQWSGLETTLAGLPARAGVVSAPVRAQLQAAQAQVEAMNYAAAAQQLERLVRQAPAAAPAWSALGYAQLRLGHWVSARASLMRAIELQAGDASAWAHLAEVLAAQDRSNAAAAALRLAIYLAADRQRALQHLQGEGRAQQHPAFQALVQQHASQLNPLPARPVNP